MTALADIRAATNVRITEKEWQNTVVNASGYLGYTHYHTYDSRRSARGFPDLVLVRPASEGRSGRVLFVELKTERGKMSPYQQAWLDRLAAAGAEAYVWRPSDWDDVLETLQ